MDPRVVKLAQLLVNYCLELKEGQILRIQAETVSYPLIRAVFEEAINVGAQPYVATSFPDLEEYLLRHGSETQLGWLSPITKTEISSVDAWLVIWGSHNTRYLSGVDAKRQAVKQHARGPIVKKLFKRIADGDMRWVGTQFPTLADAQEAEMSLRDYEDFVFRAGHIHTRNPVDRWMKMKEEQERLVAQLDRLDQIHVRSDRVDLKLRVGGRHWISCHGTQNFPDGEIFTGPIENATEGSVRFSYPAVYHGRAVNDVELTFKKGRVVSATASQNETFLTEMLGMDPGASRLGEFAIGTNYEIKRFTRNTLFDEKIGGTFHMAVGASFPESGGRNKSALHWDMVCDLTAGEIEADGKTIYRNGKFVI